MKTPSTPNADRKSSIETNETPACGGFDGRRNA